MKDSELAAIWKRIDWEDTKKKLARLQKDIALAAIHRRAREVKLAQTRLINSIEARISAVKHVSERTHAPGIDGILWHTNAERLRAALSLNPDKYKAQPMKMFLLKIPGQKERYIQIPTVFDRAMQILYAFALDPVAESTGDKKSFAARSGRSLNDLHVYLMRALNPHQDYGAPVYVIKTDVKMCYATISHDWLRKNIPINTYVLDQFLNAGHLFQGEFFPSDDDNGIPIGASISPILANMALDGAQKAVHVGLHGKDTQIDYTDGYLLRYADDMIITARSYQSARKIIEILDEFLKDRGMKLSADKTKLIELEFGGFDFLGRYYRCHSNWVESTPSEEAVARFEKDLKEFIGTYQGGQRKLIETLNRKLLGWAAYHKITDATSAFRRIDTLVTALLLEHCIMLYPQTHQQTLIDKFFYIPSTGERTYALLNKPSIRIVQLYHHITLTQHPAIPLKMNPYIDEYYFEERDKDREFRNMVGKYQKVWARQNERCYYCGKPILTGEKKELVSINPEVPFSLKNAAYIHTNCSYGKIEFITSEYDLLSRFDLYSFLEKMIEGKPPEINVKNKYYPLALYFQKRDENLISLTLGEIEEILGHKLCKSAFTATSFWSKERVCSCWRRCGYRIRGLDLKKRTVSFVRIEGQKKGETIELPAFLYEHMPKNACVEITNFLDYIKKRYGL